MFLSDPHGLLKLENFEGPLEFLWHLVQKKEIDIYDVEIQKITEQYLLRLGELAKGRLDNGAEFIGTASSLLLYKSRKLLPNEATSDEAPIDEDLDPNFEVIHHLMEYCRFKEAAKILSSREDSQGGIYYRGMDTVPNPGMTLGIAHLSLDDLSQVFEQALERAQAGQRTINEEQWRVSDKISAVRHILSSCKRIAIEELLNPSKSRTELIVTFLALLELIKIGEIAIVRDSSTNSIKVLASQLHQTSNKQ